MVGFISKGNNVVSFYIRVNGYKEIGYNGYSLRAAIKKYRKDNNLTGKHIYFYNYL